MSHFLIDACDKVNEDLALFIINNYKEDTLITE